MEKLFHASRLVMYYERSMSMHSTVALFENLPPERLVRGQVGVVVGEWAPGIYEVEFCDNDGKTYAMVTLKVAQLITLLHEPAHQAA
jgi:hypothetical protein